MCATQLQVSGDQTLQMLDNNIKKMTEHTVFTNDFSILMRIPHQRADQQKQISFMQATKTFLL